MTIVCIGKAGQVATALAERAKVRGAALTCLGRQALDLLEPSKIYESLRTAAPRFVVNAAAYTQVDAAESHKDTAFELNATAPGVLAQACVDLGVPLLHISTDYVFDGQADQPYREDDPTGPLNVYGRSKLAGEQAVRAALSQHIILRTSWIYGPHNPNFVTTMLRLAREEGRASVVNDQIGAPTSALELADAILTIATQILETPASKQFGIFHFTASGACSWAEFAALIFSYYDKYMNCTTHLEAIPSSDYPTPARRPMNSRLATDKIENVYGITPKDWTIGVAETVTRLLNTGER